MKIKRFVTMLLTALFMLSMTAYVSAYADDPDTVLYESSFDSGSYDGWYSFGNQSTLDLDNVHSYDGSSSLKAFDRSSAWSGPAMNITKYLNGSGSLYFDARMAGINQFDQDITMKMTIRFTDSFGTDTFVTVDEAPNERNVWKRLRGPVDVPSNISDAMLYFEASSASLDFCIDHVVISSVGEIVPLPPPDRSPNDPEYSFDFEKNLEGWCSRGDMSININTQYAYKGKNSVYASNRTLSWNGPTVRLDRVLPGRNYTYSAYVYYNGKEYEPEHVFCLELQYVQNGEEVYKLVADKVVQKGTWSNITGSYTVPEDATNVYMYIKTEFVSEGNEDINDLMSFYVDNVSVIDTSIIVKQELKKVFTRLMIGVAVLLVLGTVIVLIAVRSRKTKDALRTASLDFMTKAYNRNAFESAVEEFVKDPDKLRKLFITSCDVNFLKYINDNYGHESGDRAIIRCASVLLRSVSKKGRVYRTGGDEFICITPENPEKKIRAEFTLESNKYEGYPFSIALGTVIFEPTYTNNKPDIQALITASDQAMYKDKQRVKSEFAQFSGMPVFIPKTPQDTAVEKAPEEQPVEEKAPEIEQPAEGKTEEENAE